MDMKRDYYEDIQLCRSWTVRVATILLLALLAAIPFLVGNYTLYILNYSFALFVFWTVRW
ncbi:hypothetical protein Desti_4330 [Desulfomonile tiedjei DSM 6799]|uniref:Uncharacterized protein n=1 Tax=Desulfomonile tiedjei (strain ATCC 49306 / DSM 6799 / DCB-1) TaxID=706587 RepID=I4CBM2_DESTA|nr:hypothetical protein Desti_4330 [Desulfomonile tiedjei DSM 6799]